MWEPVTTAPDNVLALASAGEHILAATTSGLYASTDDGDSWHQLVAGRCTAVAALDHTICVGAGNVTCSTDAGATWRSLASFPMPEGASEPILSNVTALAIGPGGTVWAAVRIAWTSFYPTSSGDGPPLLHSAGMTSGAIYRYADDRWSPFRRRNNAGGFAFAGDRTFVAADDALHVDGADGSAVLLERATTCVAIDGGGRIVTGTTSAAYASSDGKTFKAIGPMYKEERGDRWGSVTNTAADFSAMLTAADGTIWAAARGLGSAGVLCLDPGKKLRWRGANAGLLFVPGEGMRSGVSVLALAITAAGTGFAGTARHGLFRRRSLLDSPRW